MLSTAHWLEVQQRAKRGGRNFCQFFTKNKVRYTTFSLFLLKYWGQNYTNFQRPEKGGSKWWNIYSNFHIVSTLPGSKPLWWLVNIGSGYGLVHQATSHYLNQFWPCFMTSYGINRPHWGFNKIADMLQTASRIQVLDRKMFILWLKFLWNLFQSLYLKITPHAWHWPDHKLKIQSWFR